jgi:hypothetical protein
LYYYGYLETLAVARMDASVRTMHLHQCPHPHHKIRGVAVDVATCHARLQDLVMAILAVVKKKNRR